MALQIDTQIKTQLKTHIRMKNLSVRYDGQQALNSVTLIIPDKKITAIVGPSGCGKTTLLKSLNRLIDLYDEVKVEGEVLVDGENIYDPKTDLLTLRKKVGFLSQRPYPLPMSIHDNVAFGPKIHGRKGQQIFEQIKKLQSLCPAAQQIPPLNENPGIETLVKCYLRLAGLWEEVKDRLHTPASRLSVGQLQRLALARALAVNPEVILADEPTSALDPVSSRLIEQQFQLLKESYTVVVVTHVLQQAHRIADYIIFLYMGELVEHGPAEQLFTSPQDERTRAYLSGEFS